MLGWFNKQNATNAVKVITDHKNDTHMNAEDSTLATSRLNIDTAIKGIQNIIEVNKLRQSDNNFTGLQNLKVDDYLMAVAMAQSAASETIWDTDTTANPHSQLYYVGENIAFGSPTVEKSLFWLYTSEKFAYDNQSLSK